MLDTVTVNRATVEETYRRIRPFVRRTPVVEVEVNGTPALLKLEIQQHTGSFKVRGAFGTMLGASIPPAGVAAASGGNHGAAVAYAARTLGVPAHIFVPLGSPEAKIKRIRGYGAQTVVDGKEYEDAVDLCATYAKGSGALNVHAYDEAPTLNGQGTLGAELEEQAPDFDTVLIAVGGGGFIGGVAAWFEGRKRVIGVEPATCTALHASLAAGELVDAEVSGIAVDSLGARRMGNLMFPIARRAVEQVVLVSDDDMRRAQRWLWDELRVVTEPGGCAAFAALLSGAYSPQPGEKVVAVLCGGNTDLAAFSAAIAKVA